MPKKINPKTIASLVCFIIIIIALIFIIKVVFQVIKEAKTIDANIAKSSSVMLNKTNLDKAMQILNSQQEPVPEQFWMDLDTIYNERASASAQVQ